MPTFYVYILKSKITARYYIGRAKDVSERLMQHNRGRSRSTKSGRPWVLAYTESYPSRSDAMQRERFLKSPRGWKTLQQIKKGMTGNQFLLRSVAQPGSALAWGARGPGFKSRRSDFQFD
jgi:putative endonuclease